MKKNLTLSVLLLIMLLLIPTFSGTVLAQKPIELNFGYSDPPTNFTTLNIIVPWAERMEEATNGRVKFIHYPSNTLYPVKDGLTALETGITDVQWSSVTTFPGRFPLTEVMFLPFLSPKPDSEVFTRVVNELYDTTPEVQKEYEVMNMKLLYLCGLESYCVCSAKKPVHTLEDLKGLKVRVSGRIPTKVIEKLGATPVNVVLTEVYDAAAKGVIDAALLSTDMIVAFQLHQVYPYVTKVPLWASVEYWGMNKDTFEGLPQDIQEQIMSVNGLTAGLYESEHRYGEEFQKQFEEMQKKDKKEITWYTLPADEIARWKELAGPPLWEEWIAEVEEKGLPGRMILEKTQELFNQYAD